MLLIGFYLRTVLIERSLNKEVDLARQIESIELICALEVPVLLLDLGTRRADFAVSPIPVRYEIGVKIARCRRLSGAQEQVSIVDRLQQDVVVLFKLGH